ncbi:hypothetical protein LCGC14_0520540 [marine sediment metagenome]|uniref:Uncharacterized protein n=1 Tax=marine sediment metagenome TaxID=412755 RepID=A0A0F9UK59_9ZZZZ
MISQETADHVREVVALWAELNALFAELHALGEKARDDESFNTPT